MASPQARQDALRVAVAQAVSGKNIDVEPIIRNSPEGMMESARRQATPQSSSGVDFQASEAASDRLKQAPSADMAGAQSKLDEAMTRLSDLRKNLESGGFDPERLARMDQEMKTYDDQQAFAKALGAAARAAAVCGLRT